MDGWGRGRQYRFSVSMRQYGNQRVQCALCGIHYNAVHHPQDKKRGYALPDSLANGKDYAVGIDEAKALSYKSTNAAVTRHCKGSVKHGSAKKIPQTVV